MTVRRTRSLLVLGVLAWGARAEAQGWSLSDDPCAERRPYVEWAIDQVLASGLPPLLYFYCPSCAPDELPEIEVSEADTGSVRAGRVEQVRDEHGQRVPFVRWVADQALEEGAYQAFVTLPESLTDSVGELDGNPWPFGVARGPEPRPELDLALEAALNTTGLAYTGSSRSEVCGLDAGACASSSSGTRFVSSVALSVGGSPSGVDDEEEGARVSGAYAHRVSVYADDELALAGEWGNLVLANSGEADFHITSRETLAARQLCVQVESLRVTDGVLGMQARQCVANPAFGRPSRPAPYVPLSEAERASCVGLDGGAGDPWLTAWCDDNFLDCASSTLGGGEACAGYLTRCEGYEAPLSSSEGSNRADAGTRGTAPLAASARDGGCGCFVASRRRRSAAAAWWLAALTLALAARRRVRRRPGCSRASFAR